MLLEPEQVLAASATDELLKLGREWRQGPPVAPFMNLGMAISKGDSAGTIMVAGGEIGKLRRHHVDGEIAVVDAVGSLVEKHNSIAGTGPKDISELGEDMVGRSSVCIPGGGVGAHAAV